MTPLVAMRQTAFGCLAAALASLSYPVQSAVAPPTELLVAAGPHNRVNTLVPVKLPPLEGPAQQYELRRGKTVIPVQLDADGRGWFLLPAFPATPATPHVAWYRFVVSDGAADPALLDRIWRDFAEPPLVTQVAHAAR
jgi:hypothetical protein